MEWHQIRTQDDIDLFLEKTNGLHDGYLFSARFENNGIVKVPGGHQFFFDKRKLTLSILVTSIWDTVVEIEFEGLSDWTIRENGWDVLWTEMKCRENGGIEWEAEMFEPGSAEDTRSFAAADSVKWRFAEK